MIFDIQPLAKPRMTGRDKYRPAHKRYWAFKEECQLKMKNVELDGANVVFMMPMPKSWSMKKRYAMLGEPHRQKPDLDNLIKALGDALYGDDSHIATISASKRWGDTGAIIINRM